LDLAAATLKGKVEVMRWRVANRKRSISEN
jgi:hypothetical protein